LNRVDRSGEPIYLILDDTQTLKRAKKVVADYLRRLAIERLIKDEKQHLGLGAYRVLRDRAVVRHLHLVDCAYACLCVYARRQGCLTHLGMDAHGAQGNEKKDNVLRLPSIRQLKAQLRQEVWNEAVKDVVRVSHERPVIRRLEKLLAA